MTERELQSAINEVLGWSGWLIYHTHDSRRSQPGFPDIVAVKGNRVMYVELKTAKGKVRPDQIIWLDTLAYANQEVYLVRPDDIDKFHAVMLGDFSTPNLTIHWHSIQAAANDMG